MKPCDAVEFWAEAGPGHWFAKDERFDARLGERFGALHHSAARRELDDWAATPEGALALLLLLDQFPRNMFRGSAHAFATDSLARAYARQAIAAGHDRAVPSPLRQFFYLPLEHSEDLADQDMSIGACEASGDANLIKWAHLHRDIIARFGRFPHRNAVLGRNCTPQENAFHKAGGFAG